MRLTVLGSSASYAAAGQACSGYLLEAGGARVLFDAGNGVLAHLASVIDPLTLDAVFITHEHPDHFLDLYALQALLRFAPDGPAAPIALHAPKGLFERMGCLLSQRGQEDLAAAFHDHTIVPGQAVHVAGLVVTPHQVEHTETTYALVAEADGARLCYSSDTSPTEPVLEAARGADMLIAEATLPERYAGLAPHLTATQAGELARDAGAGALLMGHIWPTNDRALMLEQASAQFSGPVHIAQEFAVYDIAPTGA